MSGCKNFCLKNPDPSMSTVSALTVDLGVCLFYIAEFASLFVSDDIGYCHRFGVCQKAAPLTDLFSIYSLLVVLVWRGYQDLECIYIVCVVYSFDAI